MKPYIYKLREPITYNGKTYEEISLNFMALKGKDMIAIEDDMDELGKNILSPELSSEFIGRLAAKASGVPFEALMELPYREFTNIKGHTRNFMLYGTVSETEEQDVSSKKSEDPMSSSQTEGQSAEHLTSEDLLLTPEYLLTSEDSLMPEDPLITEDRPMF